MAEVIDKYLLKRQPVKLSRLAKKMMQVLESSIEKRSSLAKVLNPSKERTERVRALRIYGPPGSGKSTYQKAWRLPINVGDTDDLDKPLWDSVDLIFTNLHCDLEDNDIIMHYDRAEWKRRVKFKCLHWQDTWYDDYLEVMKNHKGPIWYCGETDIASVLDNKLRSYLEELRILCPKDCDCIKCLVYYLKNKENGFNIYTKGDSDENFLVILMQENKNQFKSTKSHGKAVEVIKEQFYDDKFLEYVRTIPLYKNKCT